MRGTDLTKDQIDRLVSAYVAGGLKASAELAAQYKVNRKYPYFLARKRGLKYFYGYEKGQSRLTKAQEDHRWQWAIERGAVSA